MVYTYWKSNFARWCIAKPSLLHPVVWLAGASLVWWKFTMKGLADERNFYIYAHPKWAPRKFHTVYNWNRDPIQGTLSEQYASVLRNAKADIEGPLKIKLPVNSY
mmetsp:Transcript_113087/g.196359  ORF Transcript_113087/g.196359 Transcript_113087/m.196359 type:complete len:105 (-) Transcript_113087:750-1064(-)